MSTGHIDRRLGGIFKPNQRLEPNGHSDLTDKSSIMHAVENLNAGEESNTQPHDNSTEADGFDTPRSCMKQNESAFGLSDVGRERVIFFDAMAVLIKFEEDICLMTNDVWSPDTDVL